MATVRILGDAPYYSRRSLAHEFDPLDYSVDRVLNDVYYLSYYAKNRDAAAADKKGKADDVEKKLYWRNFRWRFCEDEKYWQILIPCLLLDGFLTPTFHFCIEK